jgi:RNase H-like domain found in reverse transcriptase
MVNYYHDMRIRQSDVLATLAALTSKTTPWKWTDEHQHSFDLMKRIVSRETLLAYPDFSKPFDAYTDKSHSQLGAAICQNDKPMAFYSRKLNPSQTRYTTTERKLLAIVETLKEFCNVLLGHTICIFTDHQNLTYKISIQNMLCDGVCSLKSLALSLFISKEPLMLFLML